MLAWLRKLWHTDPTLAASVKRPAGVSRRDFLRSAGITSVTVAFGGGTMLWKPSGLIKPAAKIPEFFAYQTVGAAVIDSRAVLKADLGEVSQSARLLGDLADPNSAAFKTAVDAVNAFTRRKMREEGFYRKIMPMISITNDELDRGLRYDLPVPLVERSPRSLFDKPTVAEQQQVLAAAARLFA